jgi:MFS transporter, DHA3 family, tetracycline resistance protein
MLRRTLNLGILAQVNAGKKTRAGRGVATTFLRWTCMRAVFHRGYVLVSGLYFVVTAHLSASQLLFLGTVMSVALVLSDIPAGVWSDTFSRKWPLVIGHGFLAAGMVMTGVVTAFPLILATHVLWGLGWAFSGGADVAWLTDELDQPDRVALVLTARARWDLVGGAAGMVAFGVIGWATGLTVAIVVSGAAMALLGLFVAARFTEDNFTPAREQRWSASLSIFRRGVALARRDHEILLVFAATMIINGAGLITWLFPRQLVDLGFPNDPVLWYTALGIFSSAVGVIALHIVEARIDGIGAARRIYALTCFIGVLGLFVLASAPNALIGGAGVLLVGGIAFNVTRAVSVIWVNRRTTSDVRATVHSFLSQAETTGEISGGFALAVLAHAAGIPVALVTSGALIACAGAMVARSRTDRSPAPAAEAEE